VEAQVILKEVFLFLMLLLLVFLMDFRLVRIPVVLLTKEYLEASFVDKLDSL
jgi:hypothetical protein